MVEQRRYPQKTGFQMRGSVSSGMQHFSEKS